MLEILPWLIAMGLLIGCSAFFSASEAALFSLTSQDRRELAGGTLAQQIAAGLLADPDRLLSAVLFWNLVTNITYFALASILERHFATTTSGVWALRLGSLLAIIFFSEMLPKCLGVLIAKRLATAISLPLATAVRSVDPIMPTLRLVNLLSRRLLWPHFEPEPYLETADLERAIELSTSDAQLLDQEQTALRNIVALSEHRVVESMRPRTQLRTFRPPVKLSDLEGRLTPSGYLLITEVDSDEIESAIHLQSLADFRGEHLERHAEPVLYVPWCTTVADAFQQLQAKDRNVAAVVNEWGETIGALTREDILDAVFTERPSRSQRLLNQEPLCLVHHGLWQATGMTNLRMLAEYFDTELPPSHSATVAGVIQECLQRLPNSGDQCEWGPFHFEVVDAPDEGHIVVHVSRQTREDSA